MISVLSSFILSLLQAIQSLTDSAQDWMSSSSLAKCSGLEDLCSCVSSANKWYNVLWCLMTWPNGVMYMANRTGPNTEPWGTPYFNTIGWDALPPGNTVWLRSVKYDSSHRSTTPDMPKLSLSLFSSILRCVVPSESLSEFWLLAGHGRRGGGDWGRAGQHCAVLKSSCDILTQALPHPHHTPWESLSQDEEVETMNND